MNKGSKVRPTSLTICSGGRSVFWPASISHSPGVVLHNAPIQLASNFNSPHTTDHRDFLCLNSVEEQEDKYSGWRLATSLQTVSEQHKETAMTTGNSQMSQLWERWQGTYGLVKTFLSTCPSSRQFHIKYWGCPTYREY